MTELKENTYIKSFYENIIINNENSFAKLKEIGEEITQEIINNQNDIYSHILLNETLIRQGLAPNAVLISEKIWNIGRKIDVKFEKLYLNQLINLGFNDKAQIFCKNKINDNNFADEIYKLSIQNSELFLLKKILPNLSNQPDILICNDFINYLHENKLEDIFSEAMNSINKTSFNKKFKTEYKFINIDDKPVLDIKIYIHKEYFELDDIENNLEEYFAQKKTDKFINLSVLDIK